MARKGFEKKTTPSLIDPKKGIELLNRQKEKLLAISKQTPIDMSAHDAWSNTTESCLIKIFGPESNNISEVIHASGGEGLSFGMDPSDRGEYNREKIGNQLKMIDSCIEQLAIAIELDLQEEVVPNNPGVELGNKVFIVHGHNHVIKESVTLLLTRLKLHPIILHEQPNRGRTIIEKFTDYSDVRFAVVILSADDVGAEKTKKESLKLRTRQNVVLELGFFLGKLGRANVCPLYEAGVEIPSDYDGVVYLPLDKEGKWKFDLLKELKAAGFEVDANKIL